MPYDADAMRDFATRLFIAAGLEADKAVAVATYLLEADLMGHTTHGLALAPWYLRGIEDGVMTKAGAPEVVSDRGAAICWRGRRLPGAWLTSQGLKLACERAQTHGTATLVIGDSHHIGALAAYLHIATDQGLLASIASSSPSGAQVAPFGGTQGVFTPDPVAWGIPAPGAPILIDISASITTANMCARMVREGRTYPHDWLMDSEGSPTRDPRALSEGGSLLPTGGLDHGQKGYGMALSVEALTQGLAGYGRADAPAGTNAAVTISVHDPQAFGGVDAFLRQMGWLADACRASHPRDPAHPVRLPGQAALARKAEALASGVRFYPGIVDDLAAEAERYQLDFPAPLI
ncbi:Ldh family oxidoreductase [Falsirhodobacter halotolerans]|uniref:Ldh family oxidoreductase n=1 Tax=Falsirhodobacter halotolerans TaxID=1146892 RepID=UPI001FD3C46C|nr:Ldh family oxidoreductase [Falsirhodobacter halotolerans]MCJ8141044.1 Ldh family oxidoreductase [Falsirhodobacter halotolerans]